MNSVLVQVRKWQSLIEAHVDVKTTDGYVLRMFCLAFTKKRQNQMKKTCYAQTAQIKKIRAKMVEIMKREAESDDLKSLVAKLCVCSTRALASERAAAATAAACCIAAYSSSTLSAGAETGTVAHRRNVASTSLCPLDAAFRSRLARTLRKRAKVSTRCRTCVSAK